MNFTKKLQHYVLLLILLLFITIELPIIAAGYLSKPTPADAIVILGAKLIGRDPSTMLRLRLEEALILYQANYAATIIVSGAQGLDEEISEAQAMRDYLVDHGVPGEHILVEDNSFNTYQNLVNSKVIMNQYGLKQIIIVSNASHIHRALVIAHNLGIEASGAPAPMANNSYLTAKQYAREGAAMIALMLH